MLEIHVRADMTGLSRALDVVEGDVQRAAVRELVHAAHAVKNSAQNLIMDGQKSGRLYQRGARVHQASAPGEAPASDTGNLVGHLYASVATAPLLEVQVVADTPYAAALEYGSRKVAPRPFMRPALDKEADEIERRFQAAVAQATR